MNNTAVEAHHRRAVTSFPLVPRTRPPGRALDIRVVEVRNLAREAAQTTTDELRLLRATEALNKAALIASDCGLVSLAQQLCWRQFDRFLRAAPLATKAAKIAFQPIVDLGRLATRNGEGERAYRIYEAAYRALDTQTATEIDSRHVDFHQFVAQPQDRHEARRFLWTVLLADGTRALTQAGRWDDALTHIERYKGLGKRMLDGRQIAILARSVLGDTDTAVAMLDDSSTVEPWEDAVTTCLRTLCLRMTNGAMDTSAASTVEAYLRLRPIPEHLVFRIRLGLCVLDLTEHPTQQSQITNRIIHEATTGADAYTASEVLSHELCWSNMTDTDQHTLTNIVERSGLKRGTMPTNLLDALMTAADSSEEQLARVLPEQSRAL